MININSSKGVGVQQITCTGGGQYSVWDFVCILIKKRTLVRKYLISIGWFGNLSFNL